MQRSVLVSCVLLAGVVLAAILGHEKAEKLLAASAVHELVGLMVAGGMALHLGLYWQQVRKSPAGAARKVFMLLSKLICVLVILSVLSGIIISPQLGFGAMHTPWRAVHHLVPKLALILILVHVVWNAKKLKNVILSVMKR
ncbi:hypothetical protein JW933_10745 [candidate division FCPU426 bacterium]|nr:hypothetical protein [candidate division FCPU426 bacterium]